MPPPMRYGSTPNNLASHYPQQYGHAQGHGGGLPPPSMGNNPGFINSNVMSNPFAVNGNALNITGNYGGSGLGMQGGTGLASHAAQMGFANASLQQHGNNGMGEAGPRNRGNQSRIRDVWKSNLQEEMAILRQLVDKYQYIAMDIEFPGVVARPMGSFQGKGDYHYQCLRCNVDLLKVIQLGITLFTEDGNQPNSTSHSSDSGVDMPGSRAYNGGGQIPCTWQFNFKFSLENDMYSEMSIQSSKQAGLQFEKLDSEGIDHAEFASLLISSGLVCDEDVRWISFHGGYDFGYLTKLMLCQPLPDDEREYDMLVKKYFPSIYDVKYLIKYAIKQHSMGQLTPQGPGSNEILAKVEQKPGLDGVAEAFKIKRQGNVHQAGADALVTGRVFFKLREAIFNGEISDNLMGSVWGLNLQEGSSGSAPQHSTPQHYHQQMHENTTPNQNGNGYGNGPSTPNTGSAGLASTPGHNNSGGMGPMTPGGGGGVFGSFQFGKA